MRRVDDGGWNSSAMIGPVDMVLEFHGSSREERQGKGFAQFILTEPAP
jgi:hypothetical protein